MEQECMHTVTTGVGGLPLEWKDIHACDNSKVVTLGLPYRALRDKRPFAKQALATFTTFH